MEIQYGRVIHIGRGRENTHIVPKRGEYELYELVPGYDEKIIDEFFNQEQKFEGFINNCQFINGKMFYILCDWIYKVSKKFKQISECYLMAVRLIVQYLYKVKTVKISKLQLLGTTALFIADKYESIYPTDLREYKFVCDNTYSLNEFREFEIELLTVLNFDIMTPTLINFLSFFVNNINYNLNFNSLFSRQNILKIFSYYYVSTFHPEMEKYYPSMIAATCIYIIICDIEGKEWNNTITSITRYSEDDLKECIKDLKSFFSNDFQNQENCSPIRLSGVW